MSAGRGAGWYCGLIILIATVVVCYAGWVLPMRGFLRVEERDTLQHVVIARQALLDELDELKTISGDWARRDGLYEFVADRNTRFERVNLTDTVMRELDANIMYIADLSGVPVAIKSYCLQRKRSSPFLASFAQHFHPGGVLLRRASDTKSICGLLVLPEGPLLFCAQPVLTSDARGPARGTFVLARFLDDRKVKEIYQATHQPVTFERIASPSQPVRSISDLLTSGAPSVEYLDEQVVVGSESVHDIYGIPVLRMSVRLPRVIYQQGKSVVLSFVLFLVTIALIFAGTTSLMSRRLIHSRMVGKESEDRYRTLIKQTSDGVAVVEPPTLRILETNEAFRRITGHGTENENPLFLNDVLVRSHTNPPENVKEAILQGGSVQTQLGGGDHPAVEVEISSTPISMGDQPILHVTFRDITDRKRAERVTTASRDFYLKLFNEFPTPVWCSDSAGQCNYFNPAWSAFTGRPVERDMGEGWLELVHPEDTPQVQSTYEDAVRSRKPFEMEYRLQHHDGTYHWVMCFVRPLAGINGEFTGLVTVCYDITSRKEQEAELAHLASHDSLTGLPNRRFLEEILGRSVARARRGHISTLLVMDLDNFKLINDTLGHFAGDQLLIELAQVLRAQLRDGDLLARLGGDEFAVLLEETRLEDAQVIAERLRVAVKNYRFVMADQSFDMSVSIGVVLIEGEHDPTTVLSLGDASMYHAKERGRNRVALYRSENGDIASLTEANRWVMTLKEALKSEEQFVLHYQPVVRLRDGEAEHYEALVRLKDKDGGIVPPSVFIPIAERFGLSHLVTRWVIGRAVQVLQANPSLRVFVNLSAVDLSDSELLELIEALLRGYEVAPERLGFEIAETAAIREMGFAQRWIQRIKELGCRFALDDFGSGFNSFAYLRRLPVDFVKIEGAFIRSLENDLAQRTLVQAMHTVVSSLGKQTIAECVENGTTVAILRELGVEYGQGYHLGRPAPEPWAQPPARGNGETRASSVHPQQ